MAITRAVEWAVLAFAVLLLGVIVWVFLMQWWSPGDCPRINRFIGAC